jgi:hypothetical protein
MALNRVEYYRNRVAQLRQDVSMFSKTIADQQQRLEMVEAELFAVQTALQLEDPQAVTILPETEAEPEAETASGQPSAEGNGNGHVTHADSLRAVLRQYAASGAPPSIIFAEMGAQGNEIKKDYLYALLSRLTARGELKRVRGNYFLRE